MNSNKMKRGTIVLINGEPCGLTSKPKKAIDGTWIVFHKNLATGENAYVYLTDIELADENIQVAQKGDKQ